MEPRALLLRERFVSDIADQDVLELPRSPAAWAALVALEHEVAARGGDEQFLRASLHAERGERLRIEDLAAHCGPLQRPLHRRRELIEARREESLERHRHVDTTDRSRRHPAPVTLLDVTGADEHPEHLLDIERIALRTLGDRVPKLPRQI